MISSNPYYTLNLIVPSISDSNRWENMDSLQTEDGQIFLRSLAQFIRQHEKALANSLQLTVQKRQSPSNTTNTTLSSTTPTTPTAAPSQAHGSLASALSLAGLKFMSQSIRSAHLTLTPHHLFYLLSRIEELSIAVGPMNVRIQSLHSESVQSNYVSFLQSPTAPKRSRGDADSIHSVSSIRSVMSGMSAFWSSIGMNSSASKNEKAKAAAEADLKYLYSAFTKLPSLRLTSDPRARLIKGYEEFPFDTAVPLFVFKNVQQLDIIDMDFRQFHGWDRLADQLCLLTVKRGNVEDLEDLLTNIVLDDAEKRRRRSTRNTSDIPSTPSWTVPSTPSTPQVMYGQTHSETGSPEPHTPGHSPTIRPQDRGHIDNSNKTRPGLVAVAGSVSPKRPTTGRPVSSYRHARSYSAKMKRSGSGSSNSSDYCVTPQRSESTTNLSGVNILPASKWQRLKYLSLADNALTHISAKSILSLTSSLRSLNLSSNLFTEIPDSLATLSRLASLDLSSCMIDSLRSLPRSPLPAITTLKLKSNRLESLAGIERLMSLEHLDLRDNLLSDPMEAARLTGMPNLRGIWLKNNPLTKRYPEYRVVIMNLFRKTPGFAEDIIIDDQPATYAERKALVPRVPESDSRPFAVPSGSTEPPAIVHQLGSPAAQEQARDDLAGPLLRREMSSTSARRKKSIRRHIVDLSAKDDESWNYLSSTGPRLTLDTKVQFINNLKEEEALPTEVRSAISDTSEPDPGSPDALAAERVAEDGTYDNYRARVEALREQFGSNWLTALGGQHVHADHHFATEVEQQHSAILHSSNPVMVTGGRSLG